MELRIEAAQQAQLNEIEALVGASLRLMHAAGNFQWDEAYPSRADFAADIARGELFAALRGEQLMGILCLNSAEPDAYADVPWMRREASLVLHRMAVAPIARRGGAGEALVRFADARARQLGLRYLKTDTYALNAAAQRLFVRCGYNFAGEMRFRGLEEPFYCYEKLLPLQ